MLANGRNLKEVSNKCFPKMVCVILGSDTLTMAALVSGCLGFIYKQWGEMETHQPSVFGSLVDFTDIKNTRGEHNEKHLIVCANPEFKKCRVVVFVPQTFIFQM